MTGKEYLEQYQALTAEINQLEDKLKDLQSKSYEYSTDGVQGSSKTIPYAKHSILISGYGQRKSVLREIAKLGQTYEDKLKALYEGRRGAETMLDGITDAKARVIIRYRYIDGMEWQTVADKLGGDNTEDSVRKYAERYLEKVC